MRHRRLLQESAWTTDSSPVVTIMKIVDGLIGQSVELAGLGVTLDFLIEARGVERLEPRAKFGELVRRPAWRRLFRGLQ